MRTLRNAKIHKTASLNDFVSKRIDRQKNHWKKPEGERKVYDTLSNLLKVNDLYKLNL